MKPARYWHYQDNIYPSVRSLSLLLKLIFMSVCSECIKPQPIARCITNLIIGTITPVSTAVYVYVVDKTVDDRTIRYEATSSDTGVVTIPITPQRFSEDHFYEIYITRADAQSISVKENINVGGDIAECVNLKFKTIYKNDNTMATYTNQTLTL